MGDNYPYFRNVRQWERVSQKWSPKPWIFILAVIFLLLFIALAFAQEVNLDIIIAIESNWRAEAVNRHSQATGLGQITPIALKDFNQLNGTHYTMADLKDPQRNMRISYWTLTERIPQLLRHFKKAVTVDHILWVYNSGIGNLVRGIKPRETVAYIKHYKEMSRCVF